METFVEVLEENFDTIAKGEINEEKQTLIDLQSLLALINHFIKVFEICIRNEQGIINYKDYFITDEKEESFKILMTFGGQLVYKIRTLLLKEEIDYILGGYDSKNNQLKQAIITQPEILNNLKASLTDESVQLQSSLENINNLTEVSKHINELWNQIKELSDYEQENDFNYDNPIPKEEHNYYQKIHPDKKIFMRYATENDKKIRYGYYSIDNKYSFFNDGWLFEWFNAYIRQGHIEKLKKSLFEEKSLGDMMQKIDNVRGYRGGDFKDIEGRQFQVKFKNLKVISFKSIITVLNSIKKTLQSYYNLKRKTEKSKSKVIKDLVTLFTTQNRAQIDKATIQTIQDVVSFDKK